MKTCRSCIHSFSVFDSEYYPVLMCGYNKRRPCIAIDVCDKYERESGADEN